jgi:hypothetical protein
MFYSMPKGFFPQEDTGMLFGFTQADPDISFAGMEQRQLAVLKVLAKDPDIADFVVTFTPARPCRSRPDGPADQKLGGEPTPFFCNEECATRRARFRERNSLLARRFTGIFKKRPGSGSPETRNRGGSSTRWTQFRVIRSGAQAGRITGSNLFRARQFRDRVATARPSSASACEPLHPRAARGHCSSLPRDRAPKVCARGR